MATLGQVMALRASDQPDPLAVHVAHVTAISASTVTAALSVRPDLSMTVPYLKPAPEIGDLALILTSTAGNWCLGAMAWPPAEHDPEPDSFDEYEA